MTDKHWHKLMSYGKLLGCHQLAERSFFFGGYQFPVCARCTGVLIAYPIALISFFFKALSLYGCFICCFIMFFDWFIQKLDIKKSTNSRRLFTGFLGGYGLMTLVLHFYRFLYQLLF